MRRIDRSGQPQLRAQSHSVIGARPPPAARRLDESVTQLHSAGYRNPQALPEGAGAGRRRGNSGFQIAEELAATR
jgi:hypothetical protein